MRHSTRGTYPEHARHTEAPAHSAPRHAKTSPESHAAHSASAIGAHAKQPAASRTKGGFGAHATQGPEDCEPRISAPEAPRNESAATTAKRPVWPWALFAIIAGIIAIALSMNVFGIFDRHSALPSGTVGAAAIGAFSSSATENDFNPVRPCTLSCSDFDAIPADAQLSTFNLNSTIPQATLSESQAATINDAILEAGSEGAVGFVFIDLNSGRGIAFNAGESFYPASTIKAAYALYLLENVLDSDLHDYDAQSLENALVWSDNDSYDSLRQRYDDGFNDWLREFGVEGDIEWGNYYPDLTPLNLSKIWLEIYAFLQNDKPEAQWFAEKLHEAETSFIGQGLDGSGATVMNKGGWIDEWASWNFEHLTAVNDAALIEADDTTYLMVIMADVPNSAENTEAVAHLARTLYDQHGILNATYDN